MASKIKLTGETLAALNLNFSEQILYQAFRNPKFNKHLDDCSTIYHYTSLTNLKKIIKSQSLYFTNLFYLNDKSEFKYGIEFIRKVIEDIKPANRIIGELIDKHIENKINSKRFIICFSLKEDLLSQWKDYGDNGCGVSIGFHNHHLKSCLAGITEQTHIDYDEKFQFEKFKEIIQQHIAYFARHKESIDWGKHNFEEQVAISVMDFCEAFFGSLKHPGFFEENEYRFTHVYNRKFDNRIKIKHRLKDGIRIPFIEIPTKAKEYAIEKSKGIWDDLGTDKTFAVKVLPIQKIILGPCVDENIVIPSLELLLKNNGYVKVEIVKSGIPFRNKL
jgi:DUF2971 family protein